MLCIAGKNNIACEILEYALQNYNGKIYVLPNDDDFGNDTWQKSLRKFASEKNVSILHSLDSIMAESDLILLSLEYNKIIDIVKFKSNYLYNVHFSLLPKYKGMYTSAWPILNNEQTSGVTLHLIDNGIDTGDIIDQVEFEIGINDTARNLYFKYLKYAELLVKDNWNAILTGDYNLKQQEKFKSTYYSRKSIDYKNIKVDLYQTAVSVHNQIRAYSFVEYQMPKVFGKFVLKSEITDERSRELPGTVIFDNGRFMKISSIDYNVLLYYNLNL